MSKLEIDPYKLLTKEQKEELGNAIFEKLKKDIEESQINFDFSSFTKGMLQSFKSSLEYGDLGEEINWSKIGKAFSDKVVEALKK